MVPIRLLSKFMILEDARYGGNVGFFFCSPRLVAGQHSTPTFAKGNDETDSQFQPLIPRMDGRPVRCRLESRSSPHISRENGLDQSDVSHAGQSQA